MALGSNRKVGFSNDVDVEEAAPVDEESAPAPSLCAKNAGLSKSSKAWDIDGDGELDEAELALKALDKNREGTLSKQQMYQLMNTNLTMHGELKTVKRVVYLLVAFTVLLALANVGVSIAAAFLSKDTKSADGNFVDSKTGHTLKTDSMTNLVTVDPEFDNEFKQRMRRLTCKYSDECLVDTFSAVSLEIGNTIIKTCVSGGTMSIRKRFKPGTDGFYRFVIHPFCPGGTYVVSSVSKAPDDLRQNLFITKASGDKLSITSFKKKDGVITYYEGGYFVNGLASSVGDPCDVHNDCEQGLICNKKLECQQ